MWLPGSSLAAALAAAGFFASRSMPAQLAAVSRQDMAAGMRSAVQDAVSCAGLSSMWLLGSGLTASLAASGSFASTSMPAQVVQVSQYVTR